MRYASRGHQLYRFVINRMVALKALHGRGRSPYVEVTLLMQCTSSGIQPKNHLLGIANQTYGVR